MNAVIAALKAAGGEELQTQQVSLYPTTDQQGKVTGLHRAEHGLREGEDRRRGRADRRGGRRGREHRRRPVADALGPGCALPRRAEEGRPGCAREGARARGRGRVRRRPRLDRRRAERRRAPVVQPGGARCEGCVDAHRAGDGRRDGRRHGLVHDPLAAQGGGSGGGAVRSAHRRCGRPLCGRPGAPATACRRCTRAVSGLSTCRPCQPSFRSKQMCVPRNFCQLAGGGGRDESAG